MISSRRKERGCYQDQYAFWNGRIHSARVLQRRQLLILWNVKVDHSSRGWPQGRTRHQASKRRSLKLSRGESVGILAYPFKGALLDLLGYCQCSGARGTRGSKTSQRNLWGYNINSSTMWVPFAVRCYARGRLKGTLIILVTLPVFLRATANSFSAKIISIL